MSAALDFVLFALKLLLVFPYSIFRLHDCLHVLSVFSYDYCTYRFSFFLHIPMHIQLVPVAHLCVVVSTTTLSIILLLLFLLYIYICKMHTLQIKGPMPGLIFAPFELWTQAISP